jgi:hypothetical protein
METINNALISEFSAVFKMIHSACTKIEGEFWKKEVNDWMYGYVLFHTIESIDFYFSNSSDEWKPLSDVSQGSEAKEKEVLKTKNKDFFTSYLNLVEERSLEILKGFSDKDILEVDGFEKRGFTSRLHKYIYLIRHCALHLGELTKKLREVEMPRIKWE